MTHFIEIAQLDRETADYLIARAREFKRNASYPQLTQYSLANVFYEASTRTRISFELAAKKLGISVINVDVSRSSESKGEHFQDTMSTLAAMGINLMVIRHSQTHIASKLGEWAPASLKIINAGDGQHAHPSQALLDIMTILEHKANLKDLTVAVVGDLKHSRVANSFQVACRLFGVGELRLIAPEAWLPDVVHYGHGVDSLQKGLKDADVVIALRVQRERLEAHEALALDLPRYRTAFAITPESLRWAKPDAIVMHPGPINRGIEMDSEVADGSQSVILEQVHNGVYMRMAIIEWLLTNPKGGLDA